jgi:hypothetical protein
MTLQEPSPPLSDSNGLPMACEYDDDTRTFRVTRNSKEKTIAAGGFGYLENSQQFLFLEDVLFLSERGFLVVSRKQQKSSLHQQQQQEEEMMQLAQADLHRLLELKPGHISLPVYLAYQHLRAQTYRVVRHTSSRQNIIQAMEHRLKQLLSMQNNTPSELSTSQCVSLRENNNHQEDTKTDEEWDMIQKTKSFWRKDEELLRLRKLIRFDAARAHPPQLETEIAWDCYNPNSQFSSTHPGFPDFQVVVVPFVGSSSLSFELLRSLVQTARQCCGEDTSIPLKAAAVSDSGTVVLLGVSDYGIPTICKSSDSCTAPSDTQSEKNVPTLKTMPS